MLPMRLAEYRECRCASGRVSKDWHHHKASKLSGGQQQRVAIARALANDPKVVPADEPTGNPNLSMSRKIIALLKRLTDQGRTVIVVTHDRSITRDADVRLDLADGRIRNTEAPISTPTCVPTPAHRNKEKRKRRKK